MIPEHTFALGADERRKVTFDFSYLITPGAHIKSYTLQITDTTGGAEVPVGDVFEHFTVLKLTKVHFTGFVRGTQIGKTYELQWLIHLTNGEMLEARVRVHFVPLNIM